MSHTCFSANPLVEARLASSVGIGLDELLEAAFGPSDGWGNIYFLADQMCARWFQAKKLIDRPNSITLQGVKYEHKAENR